MPSSSSTSSSPSSHYLSPRPYVPYSKRVNQLNLRITPEEFEQLRVVSAAMGFSQSETIRALVARAHKNLGPDVVNSVLERTAGNLLARKKVLK